MSLEHDLDPPAEIVDSRIWPAAGRLQPRTDRVRWENGDEADMNYIDAPDSVLMVAVDEEQRTYLVRQWRHSWGQTSWEVPAGTLEPDEEPLAGARRELVEEAGLTGGRWLDLGSARPSAVLSTRQHLFLVQDLKPDRRQPEPYERDMILRRLPLADALSAALAGQIAHAGSITALVRAARHLGLI